MKRYIRSSKETVLKQYDDETIEFVRSCLEEISDVEAYEFQGEELVQLDPSEAIQRIIRSYVSVGVGEGYVDSTAEFYSILNALRA